ESSSSSRMAFAAPQGNAMREHGPPSPDRARDKEVPVPCFPFPARHLIVLSLLASLAGCQVVRQEPTLPAGQYLQHPPQYFPPSAPFPLSTENEDQESAAKAELAGNRIVAAPPLTLAPLPNEAMG